MRGSIVRSAVLWIGLAALTPAGAQVLPPGGPEGADIAACLCLNRTVDALGAEMAAKRQSYQSIQSELARLDEQLQRERAGMDVNDAAAVARFRQLLAQRDAAFRRSTGPAAADLGSATGRYNASVQDYNARCANRPRDPGLLARVQATLVCPPAR